MLPVGLTSSDLTPHKELVQTKTETTNLWQHLDLLDLLGICGPHAGAAHSNILTHWSQTILVAVTAQLPLEEDSALHDRH